MASAPSCFSSGCSLTPVFKCTCDDYSYACQKHCFMHMQGLCGGKLEPFVYVEGRKAGGRGSSMHLRETEKRFEPVPMCELMTTLFPGEAIVFQCGMCGKLVPKTQSTEHICERNDICILGINFHRESYNRYTCSNCSEVVHSAFLYSHADLHNNSGLSQIHKEDISKIAALIIQNDLKPPTKGLNKGDNSQNKTKNNGNSISEVSKSIINSLKLTSKKNLPCLKAPLTDSKPLPTKRNRPDNANIESSSD